MAFPVILIHSATGSDTAASGAGPATALTGTAASTSSDGLTVTLDGSPDLTNVATDGSHVIFLNDSTAGNRNFGKITGKDNTAKTVTVANAFGASLTNKSWAIGGKRASLLSTTSKKLTDNNGAAGDAQAGWVLEMQSGHAETTSARWDQRRAGDTTSGPLIIRGASGAATRPVLTMNNADIVPRASYTIYKDFNIVGTGGASDCIIDVALVNRYQGLKISGFSGNLMRGTGGAGLALVHIIDCELSGGSVGLTLDQDARVVGCYIHNQTSHGISCTATLSGLTVYGNIIYSSGGDGVNLLQGRSDQYGGVLIAHNTIHGCTGDGIDYSGDFDSLSGLTILNNILSSNGGYGLKLTSLTTSKVLARGTMLANNNTYNNTSGSCNLAGVLEGDPGLDPSFANVAGGDFSIGTNLKALGYPTGNVGFGSSTRSYVDIGAAQRQEPGLLNRGMLSGGML